ncbi:hypothetical protein [Catenulispora subtropica]|uniref:Uncharacterized protein n=1 Tax=Catenulispora subtropica TaxID=450798 RepID=A0ABP5BYH3_9ACTN
MEFAEWVVSGLDQLRAGRLPGGEALYQAVAAGLGDSSALDAYMNGGDAAARAGLVQAIAQALAANPGLEQQLRQAAEGARSAQGAQGTGAAGPPFFKTTNGMLVLVAAAVVVVGGGIGLGVGLSGDGSGALAAAMKGTWTCQPPDGAKSDGPLTFTVGDGTWTASSAHGTWKQDGDKVTLANSGGHGNDLVGTGVPSGTGSFDITVTPRSGSAKAESGHVKGTVSEHKLKVTLSSGGTAFSLTVNCTK